VAIGGILQEWMETRVLLISMGLARAMQGVWLIVESMAFATTFHWRSCSERLLAAVWTTKYLDSRLRERTERRVAPSLICTWFQVNRTTNKRTTSKNRKKGRQSDLSYAHCSCSVLNVNAYISFMRKMCSTLTDNGKMIFRVQVFDYNRSGQ
jgi:hypothetical protein